MRLKEFLNEEYEEEKVEGDTNLFQDSLKIVFGLDQDTVDTLIDIVRRHGDTMQIRDQQVRRRAGGRAVELLKQAHEASRSEGDEQYDDGEPEMDADEPATKMPNAWSGLSRDDDTESVRSPDEEDPNRGNKR